MSVLATACMCVTMYRES